MKYRGFASKITSAGDKRRYTLIGVPGKGLNPCIYPTCIEEETGCGVEWSAIEAMPDHSPPTCVVEV